MRQPTLNGKSFLQILSLILLVNFSCGALPAMAQARRGAATRKPANEAGKKSAPQAEEKIDLTGLIPPDKGVTMSGAYQSGVLPAPAMLPPGTVEEQAFVLAEAVAAGDENSTAALITALKAAGYGVRDAEGNVDYQSGWQGMALDGWQVAAMARSYGNGVGIGLGTFGDGLEIIASEWKKETNVADLVNGIRGATRSEHSALRFWANFIIELGRRADAPYNMLNDEEVKHARLDVVQLTLIMTRLAADLNFAAHRQAQQSPRAEVEPYEMNQKNKPNRSGGAAAYFVNASYRNDKQTRDVVLTDASYKPQSNAADDMKQPCTMTEMESLIVDINATGMGFGFGEFVGYLENKKVVGSKTGATYDRANAVLVVSKLIATYAALDSEVTMDGEQMLTRTKATQPGESKTLTAKVKIDVGKWQAMNCVRPALNAAGLDFSLPNHGALAGTRVDWNLVEGGVADSAAGNIWHTVKNIPSLAVDGTMEIGDAIVFLDKRAGNEPADKKHYKYTDANGESKMIAVGMRQKRNLTKENVRPVMKKMSVNLDIQIKTMRLKDKTAAAGTANDLAGSAIAFFTKDVPGFIAGTAAETIYRSNLGSSKTFTFPVKDWIPCDAKWRGTVTYHRIFDSVSPSYSKGEGIMGSELEISRSHREYYARINVEQVPSEKSYVGELKTSALIASIDETARYYRGMFNDSCGNRTDTSRDKITERFTIDSTVGAENREPNSFQLDISGDKANVYFNLPNIAGKFTRKGKTTRTGFCNQTPPTDANVEKDANIAGVNYGYSIPVDPKNPYHLKGSVTIPGDKGKLIFSWDLSRCN